ncbi:unnamed protein product, partial [Fusarium graminearum]
ENNTLEDMQRYPTFIFQPTYKEFSLEEHRFADYMLPNRNSDHPKQSSHRASKKKHFEIVRPRPSLASFPRGIKNTDENRLSGKGVEICVGKTPSEDETWSLPVNLVSHQSAYFKAACLWNVKEQINLLGHDPAVFALFIEWMYNGSYDASAFPRNPSMHAKCWVLGDFILCREFKNYAMGRLFDEHVATAFGIPVAYEDVQYLCNSASSDSKLKLFYTDSVTDQFGDIYRLRGFMADWEKFLEDHPKTRSALLRKLRYGPPKKPRVKSVTKYLEPEEFVSESALRAQVDFARFAEKKQDEVSKPACQDDSEKRKCDQFGFNVKGLPSVRGLNWSTAATPQVQFFPPKSIAAPVLNPSSQDSAAVLPVPNSLQGTAATSGSPQGSAVPPVPNASSEGTAVPLAPNSPQSTVAPSVPNSSHDTATPVERVEERQEKEGVGDETNTVPNATQDAITKESSPSGSTSGTSNGDTEAQNTPGSGED